MQQAETKFKGWVKERLVKAGALIFNAHGHAFQASGWPDTQVYHTLWKGMIEYKVNLNTCSPLQKKVCGDLLLRSHPVLVLRRIKTEDEAPIFLELPSGRVLLELSPARFSLPMVISTLRECGELCITKFHGK